MTSLRLEHTSSSLLNAGSGGTILLCTKECQRRFSTLCVRSAVCKPADATAHSRYQRDEHVAAQELHSTCAENSHSTASKHTPQTARVTADQECITPAGQRYRGGPLARTTAPYQSAGHAAAINPKMTAAQPGTEADNRDKQRAAVSMRYSPARKPRAASPRCSSAGQGPHGRQR